MAQPDPGDIEISLPHLALLVRAGPSGAGKSTFAARHFTPTQIVSSDRIRGWISDDETDQTVSGPAFELLHDLVGKRLAAGRLTVVDSTALRTQARRDLLRLGQRYNVPVILLVFRADRELCRQRDAGRPRPVGAAVIERQLPLAEETLRRDWAAEYRGPYAIIYGHTVVPEPSWTNNTLNIDQGCVFGGRLTCLRWPEREIVQQPAARAYAQHDTPDLEGASAA
jgi:predicted kinase